MISTSRGKDGCLVSVFFLLEEKWEMERGFHSLIFFYVLPLPPPFVLETLGGFP